MFVVYVYVETKGAVRRRENRKESCNWVTAVVENISGDNASVTGRIPYHHQGIPRKLQHIRTSPPFGDILGKECFFRFFNISDA